MPLVVVRRSGYARAVHSTSELIGQILREAIEGGGVAAWATVEDWDGDVADAIVQFGLFGWMVYR